ncbi:MAG: PLP-dependent aminotransferase family protein, partial [Ktedonobacterales bacterium]|nr:PLP-dependent aminotransferase family protein [Ktedonobacterales bacterium]
VMALREGLGELVAIGPAEAGIHLQVTLPVGTDDVALATAAQVHGLAITPLSPHYQHAPKPGLLLGFGALDELRLREGVGLLAPLIRAALVAV